MQKTKVFWAPGSYLSGPQLRFNRGEAKDRGGCAEYELAYDGNLDELLMRNHLAYRVFADGINTPWCFTEEEANHAADELGVPSHEEQRRYIMRAGVDGPYLKAMELPVNESLHRNDRGLFCRLNLHPEIDGSRALGKVFFPDRSCAADLCEGPCVITEVKDKGNYGFFKGHMQQFKAPFDEALDNYIRDRGLYFKTLQYKHGKFGNYIELVTKLELSYGDAITETRMLVQNDNGIVEEYSAELVTGDTTAVVDKEITVADYFCEGYHSCKFDELVNKFIKPVFQSYNAVASDKYISDLFDDAVSSGFLRPMTIQNVFYVTLDTDALVASLMDYSRDEMAELIETVNKINREANEAIKGKIKRGQISIA